MTEAQPSAAAATPDERGSVLSDGQAIAYERWVRGTAGTVVLVHGTAAHAGWWHHAVDSVPAGLDVVAVDLAGHGDSGPRDVYTFESWANDVLAVAHRLARGPVFLVGHSIGGLVVATAAATEPDYIAGLGLIDSIVEEQRVRTTPIRSSGPPRRYPSFEQALSRFRLTPPPPTVDAEVFDYVARRSVRQHPDGDWRWKVDQGIFGAVDRETLTAALDEVRCPVVVVRGEHSELVSADASDVLSRRLGRPVPQYDVAGAYHHLMLDQPAEFGRQLNRALAKLVE